MIFGIKEKSIILIYTMNVLLAIATNIPVRLKTDFVVQGRTHTHTHKTTYCSSQTWHTTRTAASARFIKLD